MITDSYCLFVEDFSCMPFSEDAFINWGIDHIIFADKDKAAKAWESVKQNWYDNQNLWMRNSGRNGQSSTLYAGFYAQFGKTIHFDKTNNEIPTKIIQEITGKVKYDKARHEKNSAKNASLDIVRNYQVSHIWGHTKNPLLFVCPWNICFVPKMFDPFTGHEAKGSLIEKFQKAFLHKAVSLYKDLILDYNSFIQKEIHQTGFIDKYIYFVENEYKQGNLSKRTYDEFKRNIKEEFETIDLFYTA